MKLPNNSDAGQCDRPEKSVTQGRKGLVLRGGKKAMEGPASGAWLSWSGTKI